MAGLDIQVMFEFGHKSVIKSKMALDGFTHDWEVYVKGADGADISHFVEKVVFYLHETFPKPKRVLKEPPFCVKESGYAGFNLPIDVYFKTKDEPKFKYNYDLDLQTSGPMIVRSRREKYVFTNPSIEFRKKLIKGGGVGIDVSSTSDKVFVDALPKSQKPSSSTHAKPAVDPIKKHKKEPEFKPTTQFSELFGDPIKKAPEVRKHIPTPSTSKPSTSSSGGKGLSLKAGTSSLEKTSSSEKKSSTPKEDKRDEKKRDKGSKESGSEKKSVAKPSSPATLVKGKEDVKVKEEPAEKKKKEKKHKEEKESKSKHQQAEKSSGDKFDKMSVKKSSPKLTSGLSLLEEKMRHRENDKQHKSKHKKKDKEKKEKKSESKDKKRESKIKEEIKKEPEPESHSPSPPAPVKRKLEKQPPQREKPVKNQLLDEIFDNNGSSSSSSSSSSDDEFEDTVKRIKLEKISPKRESGSKKPREEDKKKKGKRDEEKSRKRRRSSDSENSSDSPPSKKGSSPSSQDMLPPPLPVNSTRDLSPEYESELRELQRKIMDLDDDQELQRLVDVITPTGKYEVTKKTFDFDLCTLDRTTVTRLQDFFRAL